MRGELVFSFTPILAPLSDYVNHIAFWKLGIFAEREETLILRHRRRGSLPEKWLCVALSEDAELSAGGAALPGWLSAPEVSAKIKFSLAPDAAKTVRLTLCLSGTRAGSA